VKVHRELTDEEAVRPENLLIRAYQLHVQNLRRDCRSEEGAALRKRAREWFAGTPLDRLPPEGAAWLLGIFGSSADSQDEAAAIRRHLENRLQETARSAHLEIPVDPSWSQVLPSTRRAHAVFLEALVGVDPESDLVGKLASGLLERRPHARWSTTEENAFALLALGRYFEAVEAEAPRFIGRAWLDDTLLFQRQYGEGEIESHAFTVPAAYLARSAGIRRLTIARDGPGSLFYQARLRYALKDGDANPVQAGFEVSRTYEGIDGGTEVQQEDDGTILVRAGALVRARLFVFTAAARRHVALVDPYPEGFENGRESFRIRHFTWKTGPGELWRFPDSEARFRDDRTEAFAVSLPRGFYVYEYLIRATTPGVFTAPAPRVEAMYEPEVFGRGAASRVEIVVK
jgi:hypothetical protein